MEATVFLDIETLPTQSAEVKEEIRAGITPPGNITKPESREKWLAEKGEAQALEAIAKTSFDPAAGHVCTIAYAINDGPVFCEHARSIEYERAILTGFFDALHEFQRYTFVGHNVTAFDLRFLICRAVVLGVKVPRAIPRDPKPWDNTVFDTMTAWAGTRGTIGLDRLCKALSIPGKDGFDGSMVAEAWANGEHDRIADYCRDDVLRVRQVWRKFEAAGLT